MAVPDAQAAKTRILFVINSLTGGGAERVMSTLLANSKPWTDRYEIALALLDDAPRAFILPAWVRVFQLDCKGGLLLSVRAVAGVVREYDPDITLSFLTRANFASCIAMMRRGRPRIISERTSVPAHLGSAFRQLSTKILMLLVYRRATRVIAVSEGVSQKLSTTFRVHANAIDVIPNPVDLGAIHALARETNSIGIDGPYIIAVGRLVRVKNYPLLIKAFARSKLACRLAIAGEGPERHALQKLSRELGIADRVVLPGWLSNPYPALAHASVFALSSNVEGFPNALVEALALGVPCVATDCRDGPGEILDGTGAERVAGLMVGRGGILTPVNDVDAYSRALQLAFQEPPRKRLVAAGPERAKAYSASTIAARYWGVIEAALRVNAPETS
jgi:glycosyltransferase involved in cell wall biosynthesis